MTKEKAMETVPVYSKAVHIYDEEPMQFKQPKRKSFFDKDVFIRRYGIVIIAACLFTIYTIILSSVVRANTIKDVRQDMAIEYAAKLEQYKAEQAQAAQAEHWLSGTASLDAAINQAVDAVAPVIAKLSTDAQKLTEACCMLARVMSPLYPNSFQEVAEQPQQWMFFDGSDLTCTEHDRELAESIIRPYMAENIVPKGLTASLVYAEWTPTDYVLRDSYKTTSTMRTWRYE